MPILGHGFDLVATHRVGRMLERHGDHFLQRCFTPGEIAYASDKKRRLEHLAARLAVKEAVVKALGTGFTQGISWEEVETIHLPTGQPVVQLHGRAAQVSAELGITRFWVSISHVDDLAAASVIAVND